MRSPFLLFLAFFCAFGADFITKAEYAKMLYLNPRGIGCIHCHGAKAQGGIISKYKEKNRTKDRLENKELKAPQINNISFEKFKKALNEPKSVMPRYFLTDEEMKILYEYITSLNKDKK